MKATPDEGQKAYERWRAVEQEYKELIGRAMRRETPESTVTVFNSRSTRFGTTYRVWLRSRRR